MGRYLLIEENLILNWVSASGRRLPIVFLLQESVSGTKPTWLDAI